VRDIYVSDDKPKCAMTANATGADGASTFTYACRDVELGSDEVYRFTAENTSGWRGGGGRPVGEPGCRVGRTTAGAGREPGWSLRLRVL
jgi:hypothetical protein